MQHDHSNSARSDSPLLMFYIRLVIIILIVVIVPKLLVICQCRKQLTHQLAHQLTLSLLSEDVDLTARLVRTLQGCAEIFEDLSESSTMFYVEISLSTIQQLDTVCTLDCTYGQFFMYKSYLVTHSIL